MRKLALKRLKASDLTLFEWHFRNHPAGNQKAITLNADVFIRRLYPSLPEAAVELGGKLPLDVSIFGPGLAGLDNRQRKIVKFGSYKNWRLDGECITADLQNPERYNVLQPGDLVVFEFFGYPVPCAAKLVFIARAVNEDSSLFDALNTLLGDRPMAELSVSQIYEIIDDISPPDDHPIRELILEILMEDTLLGGGRAIGALATPSRRYTREELRRTRKNLDEMGLAGEGLVAQYLDKLEAANEIQSFSWIAEENAVAPYDFEMFIDSGRVRVDVKSTGAEFARPLHISYAELQAMTDRSIRYDIYRVFDVGSELAKLRIAEDVGEFASTILSQLHGLPPTVRVDSVAVEPRAFRFGNVIILAAE